jgi:uncharacterized flavoprotein (TIGR03862 family)
MIEAILNTAPVEAVEVAIVGGGPAGLMAAEVLSTAGVAVHLFDGMPSVGRKFLLAGKGGLNLTHSEGPEAFASRFGARRAAIEPLLAGFGPEHVRAWAKGLGIDTFVGSTGRVFPTDMKAAPLLRAWLHRLRHPAGDKAVPVQFHMRHRWAGLDDAGELLFDTPQGRKTVTARATLLALGGGSWSRLGSDGAWVPWLQAVGVPVVPLQPANCGFDVAGRKTQEVNAAVQGWSEHFSSRFAGQPFKSVAIHFTDSRGRSFDRKGEFVATATGVEGSLIYAASSLLRDQIAATGSATFELDLLPDRPLDTVLAEVRHPRGSRSLTSHLKSRLHLDGIKMALLHELLPKDAMARPELLATAIKALTVRVVAARPIDEAISSAGGVPFEAMDEALMLKALPGMFCAGEMLDWEAPTGGYLLTASFATGHRAAQGVLAWLG